MDGMKWARIKRCARCEYGRNSGAWEWPRCCGKDPSCIHGVNRDDAFMEGPATNCFTGYWKELEPIGPTDPDEWAEWNRQQGNAQAGLSAVAPPCAYAELIGRTSCCGPVWKCTNPDCEKTKASGKFCRTACKHRCTQINADEGKGHSNGRADKENNNKAAPVSAVPIGAHQDSSAVALPKLSLVITARIIGNNPIVKGDKERGIPPGPPEREELMNTIESAAAAYPADRLEIIVIDDGSDPPLDPGKLRHVARFIRHDKARGVGAARNAGYEAATGDVISFHDPHMRFPLAGHLLEHSKKPSRPTLEEEINRRMVEAGSSAVSSLALLAMKAVESHRIISSASRDVRAERGFWASGCDIHWNRNWIFQPKYRCYLNEEESWSRTPTMMGAGYFFPRAIAEQLREATGNLWEDCIGCWGGSEELMGVKCFLLGIPILASRDVFLRHYYRGDNPIPGAAEGKYRNLARGTRVLFGDESYRIRFRGHLLKRLDEEELSWIEKDAMPAREQFAGLMERRVAEMGGTVRDLEDSVFTMLCSKGAPITRLHPEHRWTADLLNAVGQLPGHTQPGFAPRILQWRPGESTLMLKKLLPDAEIMAIEIPGHRADNWWDVAQAAGFKLIKSQVGPDYARLPLIQGWGEFDLVIIGGELQEQCIATAKKVLKEGGKIVRNEKADRTQIEDDERRKERKDIGKQLKNHPQMNADNADKGKTKPGKDNKNKAVPDENISVDRRLPPRNAQAGSSAVAGDVSVVLLNYMRQENMGPIIDCMAAQTAKPRVFLWNNGEPFHFQQPDRDGKMSSFAPQHHPVMDLYVNPAENLLCWPRWWLASLAPTEFVCCMDDDLILKDDRVLEDAVAACREECPDGIVGFFGVSERPKKGYKGWKHHNGTTTGTKCDMIKGRFMLFRKELLGKVPLLPPAPIRDALLVEHEGLRIVREDDIYLSLMISGGKKDFHRIPARLGKRFKNLPQRGTSMASTGGHYKRRGEIYRAVKAYVTPRQTADKR